MGKARFKVGQTVYMGRGDKMQTLVIEKVHKNPLLPIHQYTFEGHNFACGEQSIRATPDGRDLTMRECFVDDKEMEFRVNTFANGLRGIVGEREAGMYSNMSTFDSVRVNFRPDIEMCNWFKKYANGRLIMHVDSGQGHFVRMLKQFSKARATGIERYINKELMLNLRHNHRGFIGDELNEILQGDLKKWHGLVEKLGDKVVLVFTRPKDNKNLRYAIKNFMGKCEILLVALEADFDTDMWKKLEHTGISEDEEVVYSLK